MMPLRFLIVDTYHGDFLRQFYAERPRLAELDFEPQRAELLDAGVGVGDAYCRGLRRLGCEASVVVVNADRLQARWAIEHGLATSGNIHDQRRHILAAQVEHYRPDVLYVFEWCPLGDAFLNRIRSRVRLLAGQIASPLPPSRTFSAYHLMMSAWPPIVDHFREKGVPAEPLKLGFDSRVLERLQPQPPLYDVTFVGGFAPSHDDRIPWLENVLQCIDVDVFGYGMERVPAGSPIHRHHRGPAWGWRMYEILQRSRVTLNLHARIEVGSPRDARCAANMRMYEATGVGTCLVTDSKDNLPEMFEPGREVIAFSDPHDCVEKVRHYLAREDERRALALAGQRRTLAEHTYHHRMGDLLDAIHRHLGAGAS